VVALFKRRAESEGLRLLVEQPFQFKHQRIGDRLRLTQILFNLLGNAVKFTREGEISITLSQEQEGGHSVYHFSVKDSGIGIGQEVLDRLFQPFEQADSSISRQFGGTGLGLHISRLFADLMGGEIRVKSELHVGSTFTLVVPLEKSEAIVEQELVKVVSNQQMRIQGRVLIADDTAELQVLIKRLVESVGMVVDLAANGQEAYEMAMEHPYDLVLMDMQMPEVDGIEATRWLRREGNDVPIVALTGNVMVQHRRQFEEAGCNDFLAKPIDRNKLLKVLVRYQREQNSEEVKESVAASNHEQLKVPDLVDEDLVGMFVDRLQQALPVIQQRYESQRWSGLQQEVHVLKGSGATFGFPQITARARELEGVIKQEQYELVPSAMAELMSLIVQIIEWHQQR
jgi:CheY-like chemotaxis protein